ncbi:MAG TPA: hypothetical protein VLC09_06585, partial [Polyangiaceae bacterium]|nr:hypothetical protein [Polyangiaceae bacterium]
MSATQTEPAVRVAVLPFRVSGPNATAQAWMGDAAAMETTALLSKQQGVSVLERREVTALVSEIQRGSDPTRMATTGRLVGAERLILGELVEAGAGQVRVFIRPVRVEDGRVFDVQSALLDVDDWLDGLEDVIEELGAKAFGGSPAQLVDGKPLSPAALQLAARARGLSARGELMAALPLYEKALVERSNAWDVEADYAVLLNDLNMFDVAAARAQETLDRMPLAPALGCARTRLQAEFARGRLDFSEAREAVRLSAACGDKVVQARALTNYGRMATWVDYPLALAAFERAGRLLGPSGNGWQRCVLRFNQRDAVVVQGLDEGTAPREAWEEIARDCESAGNDYFASQAWEKASEHSFIEADRSGALERAGVDAQKCGGMRLVKARLALAEHQRRLGKPSEADATLLAALGEWLGRIAARNGGLPALERELDRDLLERAGMAQAKPAPREPLSGDLFVAAERLALATVLREWARQTESSSQRQAAVYRKLADRLAGSPASVADTSLGRLEQALAQERTSLVALEQAQAAPLRGSFYLANVEVALDERFWESLDDGTSPEEISRIQAAHAKVAGWHQAPKALVDQSRYQAERAAREGKSEDALAAVRSARTRLTRDAWYEDWLASAEDAATEDESAVASLREAQLGLARRLGASAWLNQLYYNASERARHDARACESGRADLLAAEKALAEQKAWGEAIEAYDKAIRLERLCDGGRAGPGSLELARERAKLLDSLGDPLRHLEGVVGLLREKSDLQMYPDAEELALATSLADGARELFRSGRPRDAARVAAEAEMRTAGEMWLEALDWTKSLSDSAEYPWIRGQLHHGLSSWVQDRRLSTKHLEKARL